MEHGLELSYSITILGGSRVVISPLIWVKTIVTRLITPLITAHEPPSTQKPTHPAEPDETSGSSEPAVR